MSRFNDAFILGTKKIMHQNYLSCTYSSYKKDKGVQHADKKLFRKQFYQ